MGHELNSPFKIKPADIMAPPAFKATFLLAAFGQRLTDTWRLYCVRYGLVIFTTNLMFQNRVAPVLAPVVLSSDKYSCGTCSPVLAPVLQFLTRCQIHFLGIAVGGAWSPPELSGERQSASDSTCCDKYSCGTWSGSGTWSGTWSGSERLL